METKQATSSVFSGPARSVACSRKCPADIYSRSGISNYRGVVQDVAGRIRSKLSSDAAPLHIQRVFFILAGATAAFGFAMAASNNIVSNFFENELGLLGPQFGYITAIREIPGFLLIFL